jgi:type IV pilus assembly protein PilE
MKNVKGFTLIELLIAVAIVSILMAVAVPTYRNYVQRSYLTEAFNALSTYQIRMEQSFQDNGNYGAGAACAVATANTPHFNVACALTNAGQGYTVTATANNTNGFTGYTYTFNEQSSRVTTAYPSAPGLPAACWLVHIGDC